MNDMHVLLEYPENNVSRQLLGTFIASEGWDCESGLWHQGGQVRLLMAFKNNVDAMLCKLKYDPQDICAILHEAHVGLSRFEQTRLGQTVNKILRK